MADRVLRDDPGARSHDSNRAGKRAVGERGVQHALHRAANDRIAGWYRGRADGMFL